MSAQTYFINQLHQQLVPALGCTEPVTVALACAHCRLLLGTSLDSMRIMVSANLYKNAAGVTIPGTQQQGLPIAAALGYVAGESKAGLEVLAGIEQQDISNANKLLAQGRIEIQYQDCPDVLYTQVIAEAGGQECEVVIQRTHTQVTLLRLNEQVLLQRELKKSEGSEPSSSNWSLAAIIAFIHQVPVAELAYLEQAAELNQALSEAGMDKDYGLSVGRSLKKQQELGLLGDDLLNRAMMYSAAASDARMGGAPLAAMSNSGSGNQGIAATVPVLVAADQLGATRESRLRALALSHLTAIYVKRTQDKLSALCAATTAAMGAGAAICWLLGGDQEQIEATIQTMIGDVAGVLCDGAKAGCALKVSTGASCAVKSALMVIGGGDVRADGIVEMSADDSILNLGALSQQGMQAMDRQVIELISDKQRRQLQF